VCDHYTVTDTVQTTTTTINVSGNTWAGDES